jgi:lipopolysaccharide/colanic/teichoic acid biosynthesis glycosyltransferase
MIRRCLDVVISATVLLALTPVLAGIAFLIWITDGPPIFFLHWRAGFRAVAFRMIKFRTMRLRAELAGGSLTFQADPRITPVGRFLRRCKLDELPQLLNVLRGEMTLIGPRTEVLDWAKRFTVEQREVFSAKPGLSDPVQLTFRHEQEFLTSASEYEQLVAVKVRRQIEYLRSRTLLSDLATALLSLRAIFPSRPSAEELAVYAAIRQVAAADPVRAPVVKSPRHLKPL